MPAGAAHGHHSELAHRGLGIDDYMSNTTTLEMLPPDVLTAILASVDSVHQLGKAACVNVEFHNRFVEAALRLRAEERGEYITAKLPKGAKSWVQHLCWCERRLIPPCPIAAAAMHSGFVDADGQLLTCGIDVREHGILGLGAGVTAQALPTLTQPLPLPERVISVAAHSMHTLCLTESGAVYSFGHGAYGKLGHGNEVTLWAPSRIQALEDVRIVAVTAGQQHNLVLSDCGIVYSFGSGFGGKLGHGQQTTALEPARITALGNARVAAVAAGAFHSLVSTREEGALMTFGYGAAGQLGHGERKDELSPRRVASLAGVRVVGMAGGEHHSLVVDDAGIAYSFGAGEAAERGGWLGGWLGHGSHDEQRLPKSIAAFGGRRVIAVAAGSRHSILLVDGGEVYTCGDGACGKLGHGDTCFQWTPKRVKDLAGEEVVAISAGESHSLCALRGGRVFGWGSGAVGLGSRLVEYPVVPLMGSAGNYEWAPGDVLRRHQTHVPLELEFPEADPPVTGAA